MRTRDSVENCGRGFQMMASVGTCGGDFGMAAALAGTAQM